MKFRDIVPNISTKRDKKRIATEYVIDYSQLDEKGLEQALIKTAPQYYSRENVKARLLELMYDDDRNIRILHMIMLRDILLNRDEFTMEQSSLDQAVVDFEQNIVNKANEAELARTADKQERIDLFQFVLETAWDRNDDVSPDEKNLIEKLRERLRVTRYEYQIIEAQLGYFPKARNEIHLLSEIKECRVRLQSAGLLLCFRTSDGQDYDVVPQEIAATLRELWGVEVKIHGYEALLQDKRVKSKQYLMSILDKAGIGYDKYVTVEQLKSLVKEHVKPTALLGGFSARDGLDAALLTDWCKELGLSSSGQKTELIARIIQHYDEIKQVSGLVGEHADQNELLLEYYSELAGRKLDELRKQGIISKDLECERLFEQATSYVFEKYLGHKPLQLSGTEHPDGILSYKDRLIMWDNKSRESDVSLKDHIKQFDRYITNSSKSVACFVVIGPSFTAESTREARKYQIENDVPIALLQADDFLSIAKDFGVDLKDDPFPLANFIQSGEVDTSEMVY